MAPLPGRRLAALLAIVGILGTARADAPELPKEATTRRAPEELPRNNPQGPVLKAMPGPIRDTARGFAKAHVPRRALMLDFFDLARSRMGSGTSWMPASSPMYGLMTKVGKWGFMARGNVYAGYAWFSSKRGRGQFTSTNSLMFMLWRRIKRGEFLPRVILSWEAFTISEGYTLPGQTAGYADGARWRDRQHPHELFTEIAALYSFAIRRRELGLQFYGAVAGEPALGPGSYLYRVSATPDPLAPLSYSMQDAPRVSAGVLTAGVFTRKLKFEASWFNGRAPDERRWDVDLNVPDSASTRFTYNPTPDWSAQISYGYFHQPSRAFPELALHRVTASAMYNARYGPEANWATSLVFGHNITSERAHGASILAESNWNIQGHHTIYGRAEYTQKLAPTLIEEETRSRRRLNVGTVALGYAYYFRPLLSLAPGLGLRTSITPLDTELAPLYGTRVPIGVMVYAHLRPAALVSR